MLLSLAGGTALAQDTPPTQPLARVTALTGCWRGTGAVMGKPVTIVLSVKPIVDGAMVMVEADSHATADPADRYAAHLLFAARTAKANDPATISGFWADSFGGDYTATGLGSPTKDGFEMAYAYPDASFVNRWTLTNQHLEWRIVAKTGSAPEKAFSAYTLTKAACPPTGG
ncbi:hypothetical protein BH10PSE4_BH10PSE4_13750 [soil metagenome]